MQGPPQLVRADILKLALHLFNLLAPPLIWFFDAMGKVMDARNTKRGDLSETVEVLKRHLGGLEARLQGDAKAQA